MSTSRQQQGGLSLTTLAIASAASVAAAIVVHELWRGGAIIGAALTPVIVAIVSESLRKPVDRVTAIREERRTRTRVDRRGAPETPPPPELERPDPFGIWQDDAPRRRRLDSRHLKIALVTGLVAFAIGAVFLTVTELVFGGNVGGGDRVTIVPSRKDKSDEKKTETTETQPTDTTETTPTTPTETTPTETVPPPTETTPPSTTPTTPTAPVTPPTTQTPPPAEQPPAQTP
jgi:hypothetical protein